MEWIGRQGKCYSARYHRIESRRVPPFLLPIWCLDYVVHCIPPVQMIMLTCNGEDSHALPCSQATRSSLLGACSDANTCLLFRNPEGSGRRHFFTCGGSARLGHSQARMEEGIAGKKVLCDGVFLCRVADASDVTFRCCLHSTAL